LGQRRPWFCRGTAESKEHAKEMRKFNARMKELDADDARKRGELLARVVRFFSSKHRTR